MTEESQQFYAYYLEQMKKDHIVCKEPDIVLFTIIELVGSTCYSCILYEEPVSMEEYLPIFIRSSTRSWLPLPIPKIKLLWLSGVSSGVLPRSFSA